MEIKDNNYYMVQGWMRTRLDLKSNELLIYAIIYSFSQDGKSCFRGDRKYIADFIGVSEMTVRRTLTDLVKKGFIREYEETINGKPIKSYGVNLDLLQDNNLLQNFNKMLPYNNNINKKENNNINIIIKESEFVKPSFAEIQAYAKEKKREDLADKFYEYYESRNWTDSKNKKILNWKLKFLYWLDNNTKPNEKQKDYHRVKVV